MSEMSKLGEMCVGMVRDASKPVIEGSRQKKDFPHVAKAWTQTHRADEMKEEAMDWSAINWLNLSVLTASAFLAALIGSFIGRRSYALTAFLSALIFAAIYIGWFAYLEQQLRQVDAGPDEVHQEAPAASPSTDNEKPTTDTVQ